MGYTFDPLVFSGLVPFTPPSAVPTVPTVGSLPPTAADGALYITLDTHNVYEYDASIPGFVIVAGPGVMLGIGPIDSQPASPDGAVDANNELVMQSASVSDPGLVNNTTQSFSGNKTIVGAGGGQVDALTLTSGGNTDLIIRNTGGGPSGLLIGNNAGATPDYQIYNLDAGTFTINSAAGIIMSDAVSMTNHQINNLANPSAPQDAMTLSYADATYINLNQEGVPNGVATLDGSGKIPVTQLPSVVMEYQGSWDPNTNTPVLSDGTSTNGFVYYVTALRIAPVAGLNDPSMHNFQIGDLIIYSGVLNAWQLVTPAAGVSFVNGAQGAVTVNAINQLTGDVTTAMASQSQSEAATIAAIQGTTVSGTTGTGNVVFSASPTLTGTLNAGTGIFTGNLSAANLSGTNTGDGANLALSNLTSTLINQPLNFGVGIVGDLQTNNATGATVSQPLTVTSGTTVNSNSGALNLNTGAATGSASSGAISLLTGAVSANVSTGSVVVASGAPIGVNGSTGSVQVFSGAAQGTGSSGATVVSTGAAVSTGTSGAVQVASGGTSGSGASGAAFLQSGNAGGNSGDVRLRVGTSGATRGSILFVDGSEGTVGHVWTSTDTAGRGHWAASGSSGANTSLSNLTNPTAINQSLLFGTGIAGQLATAVDTVATQNLLIRTGAPSTSGVVSGDLALNTGNVTGGTNSGQVTINTGTSAAASTGGINITTGSAGTASGGLTLGTGQSASTSASGAVLIQTGFASGTANSGTTTVTTGSSVATSGSTTISSGSGLATNGASGSVQLLSGVGVGTGNSGPISIASGTSVNATSGAINMSSGSTSGSSNSGIVTIQSGSTSSTGNTGNVIVQSGTPSSTGLSGNVNLVTGPNPSTGITGAINLNTGASAGGGSSGAGQITLTGGNSTGVTANGNGGAVSLIAGNSASNANGRGGSVILTAGNLTGTANTNAGQINITSGSMTNTSGTAIPGTVGFTGGTNAGTGSTGNQIFITAGNQTNTASTGTSGGVIIASGNSASTGSANAGNITLNAGFTSGTNSSGAGGSISLAAGAASGTTSTGNGGAITLTSGTTVGGNSGLISLTTNTASSGASGNIGLTVGDSGTGTPGNVNISAGNITTNTNTGTAGAINITAGSTNAFTTGTAGSVTITSGNATTGGSTAPSGNILLVTPTPVGAGAHGKIKLQDGTQGTIGHVWTQSATDGTGGWTTVPASGANTSLSNLTTTSINQDLIPSAANTRRLGNGTQWLNADILRTQTTFSPDAMVSGLLTGVITGRTGIGIAHWGLSNFTLAQNPLYVTSQDDSTNNAIATADIIIQSGTKSAGTGNSGSIVHTIGSSSGGTQGVFKFLKTGVASVSGQVWTASATDGTGYWANAGAPGNLSVVSKTTTYTATTSDDVILASTTGGAYTITLPNPSNTGKVLRIKKTTADFTVLTITSPSGNIEAGSGTASTTINTQYEQLTLVADGTNWQILDRDYGRLGSIWTNYTATFSAGFGTTTGTTGFMYRRVPGGLRIMGSRTTGTVAASIAQASLPTGLNFDSTNSPSNQQCGFVLRATAAAPIVAVLGTGGSNNLTFARTATAAISAFTSENGSAAFASTELFKIDVQVPIDGWN